MTEPKISVGILTDKKIVFELYGDFEVDFSGQTLSGRFKCEIVNNKLVVSDKQNKYTFDNEVFLAPSAPETEYFTIRDVVIGVQFHWERKEKQSFNGLLKLVNDNGKVTAVNILSIEDYLTSVISSEMSAKCTLELLKAHAVISRSWLLAQIEKSQSIKKDQISYVRQIESGDELIKWYDREDHVLFDVCADDHCQRYQGTTKVFTDVALQAVSETRGLVLVDDNGVVCDTRFFKACGGVTEAFENVWEPKHFPYLVPVIDYKYEPDNYNMDLTKEANAVKWIKTSPPAFCNTTDKKVLSQVLLDYDQETTDFYRWRVEYTQAELSELITKKTGFDFGEIIDLIPVERGPSARLTKMKIVGTKKTLTIGKELEIRKVLSNSHMYSSAIVVEKEEVIGNVPQRFVIFGAGWGHGVGLCQIGAAVMSENGYRFDEILMHYYKNAKMKRIY